MTLPRRFLRGATYFVTRRCTQRQFWLKPTKQTTEIFLYCLGVGAARTGVIIHGICVMSNHYHVILTDPECRVAEFYGWLHKYVAKAVNASVGRWENLWSSEKTSVIELKEREDILSKLVYTLTNPVEARLVAKASNWPGVWLYKKSHSKTIKRPKVYFRSDGEMPDKIELDIVPPTQFDGISAKKYEQIVEEKVRHKEWVIRKKMSAGKQSFMGIRSIMNQSPASKPNSIEKRRELNPKIAGKNKWLRLEALQRLKDFLYKYKDAFKRWRQGERDVIFPAGTYALRVFAGVKCEPG